MKTGTLHGILITIGVIILISGLLYGCPKYKIYVAENNGKATLKRAENSKRVAIVEAQAKKESAALLSESDILRAAGIARSNAIIGESLKNNEAYLKWLWIDNMDRTQNQVIYVPTESNMPLMEAGRLPYNQQKKIIDSLRKAD